MSQQLRAGVKDMELVGESYRQRTSEQAAELQIAGHAGTLRHRVGLAAFGPTRRQLNALQVQNQAMAFNRQHSLRDISFVEDHANAITPMLQEYTAQGFREMLRVVRKACLLESSGEKAKATALMTDIRRFSSEQSAKIAQETVNKFPMLRPLLDDIMPMPHPDGSSAPRRMRLAQRSASQAQRALTADAAPGQKFRPATLGSCLDGYWVARHRPILSGEWTGDNLLGVNEETKCYKAGHCICSTDGRRLYAFRNAFLRAMKAFAPKETIERRLLLDGFLVWRLRGEPKMPFFGDAGGGADSSSGELTEDTYLFWHVAVTNLSPYQPVFQVLTNTLAEEGGVIPDGEELAVKASGQH